MVDGSKNKLIYGVGANDVDYRVYESIAAKDSAGGSKRNIQRLCPYYEKWRSMLTRCYSIKYQAKFPTYVGCSVDPSWLYLSNFIRWVDSQPNRDWENCNLDKDFLTIGNKHYSPDTCVFICRSLNMFITDCGGSRGNRMIGAHRYKSYDKFSATCSDPFKVKNRYLGIFDTELEAHKAWQARKHEYACQLAELQEDSRVADALRQRYAPDKDWTKA
jgi:hypothetical protein